LSCIECEKVNLVIHVSETSLTNPHYLKTYPIIPNFTDQKRHPDQYYTYNPFNTSLYTQSTIIM